MLRLILILFCLTPLPTLAEDVYQTHDDFLKTAFTAIPKPQTLWITADLKPTMQKIMGSHYRLFRTKYWAQNSRSVWILEEIGKVKAITTGIVIENNKITAISVLTYRESHGWQVKYPFFTDQFTGASLTKNAKLSQNIDGISGATMSVNALKNLAKLALFFDQQKDAS